MAGHSKWANIKHKKARSDARKGKMFSRIAKEIITSVKLGGTDSKSNQRLRLALLKAKEVNMPSENVERNIKKASSQDHSRPLPEQVIDRGCAARRAHTGSGKGRDAPVG